MPCPSSAARTSSRLSPRAPAGSGTRSRRSGRRGPRRRAATFSAVDSPAVLGLVADGHEAGDHRAQRPDAEAGLHGLVGNGACSFADRYRAAIVRAWPERVVAARAAARARRARRPRSSRSSSAYELDGRPRRARPSPSGAAHLDRRPRGRATGRRGTASRRRRSPRARRGAAVDRPQSNAPSDVAGEAQRARPARRRRPSPPMTCSAYDALGLGRRPARGSRSRSSSRRPSAPPPSSSRCRRTSPGSASGNQKRRAHPQRADRALGDQLASAGDLRVVAPHERLGQHAARRARRRRRRARRPPGWRDSGFSHSTCLPASSARIDHWTCSEFGSGM